MNSLIVNFKTREITTTAEIQALKAEVLARSGAVTQVLTPAEQDKAVEAQASLARYYRAVEASTEAAKKPVNEIRAKILAWNKEMIAEVDAEGNRLGKMVAEFQLAESRRVAAARRLQDETASALTREQDEKLSKAQTVNEQEAIKDEYRDRLAAEAPPVAEVHRSDGQRVTHTWEINIRDIHMLYRNHPHCTRLSPLIGEIKLLLESGVKVAGVEAKKVLNSSVRLTKERPAIEV